MKTLPAIAAVSIAMALLLVPLAASAAGSITFTSPAAGASYTGSQGYTIAGTVSPVPTQADEVGITVKNPAGQIVDQDTATVTSGAFSYSTAVGGTASWTSGIYTITAIDSFGATGSITFTYTASTVSQYNVTAALIAIQAQLTTLSKDLAGNVTALKSGQTGLAASLTSISSSLTTLTNNLATLSSTVNTDYTNLNGQLSSLSTSITAMQAAVTSASQAASAAETAATNANNSVSSTQTYVLVVAVLAAITLVLELAILVRKLS
jgi:hypothetical protein